MSQKDNTPKNEIAQVESTDFLTRAEAYYEKNKKTIYIVIAAVVVIAFAWFAIRQWYVKPRIETAASEIFAAENYFAQQDYEKALNGDQTIGSLGFIDIIDQYGSTPSGHLARYYAGICELNLGMFAEAADHLASYKGNDAFIAGEALMLQGDAEIELGNTEKALKLYLKAASKSDNEIVAPTALFKAGMVYIQLDQNDKAIATLEQIKELYPRSTESTNVDQFIAYAQQRK